MSAPYHIKYIDSDDEELPEAAHALEQPPQQAGSRGGPSQPPTVFRCASTVRTDFETNDQCYVLKLVYSAATNTVAATLSNHLVKLYSFRESGLQFVGQLKGHSASIRDAHFSVPEDPHLLHTCASDATVRGWDTRSGQQTEQYNAGKADVLCCHSNGPLLVAGAADNVLIWDRRTQKAAASFSDTHAQEVTQVRFHPTKRSTLFSASEDGLIAVFNTESALDEDEGFLAGLNINTSCAKLGFYGTEGQKLWCCSGIESVHLWEWAEACDDMATGGTGPLGEALNARQDLQQAVLASGFQSTPLGSGIDYLIDCEYRSTDGQLLVAAGNIGGPAGWFPIHEPSTPGGPITFGGVAAYMAGGHQDIVRGILWPGAQGPLCLSGGEDARVCVWSAATDGVIGGDGEGAVQGQEGAQAQPTSSGSEGAMRRQSQASARRALPYSR